MKEYLIYALLFFVYIITSVITWRTYDFFNTTLLSSATTTGFDYYTRRIFTSFVIAPGIVCVILFKAIDIMSGSHEDVGSASNAQGQVEKSTALAPQAIQPPTTPVAKEEERTAEVQKKYTKDEIEQLEEKAQYSGDDPIIRARLGLPPKTAE